ncbi:YajG family lipoprotein [Modicisalibacter luteus]|uniref:YajG family lipoprotein n=1 Tax=Modicisalibacter luteus TaxID=453962 RepID=UPI003643015D
MLTNVILPLETLSSGSSLAARRIHYALTKDRSLAGRSTGRHDDGRLRKQPHYLQTNPTVSGNLPRIGSGQSVTVTVVDGRESNVLGTRSGAAMANDTITVEAYDVIPKLQAQAEAAISQMGFTPTTQPAPDRPSMTLTLAQLNYEKADAEPVIDKAQLLARLRAEVANDNLIYTGTYTAKREQTYALSPNREANTEMVNDVLSRALARAFNDPQVGQLLAR